MNYGSIEAGGTKFVCAIGNENFQIEDRIQFSTTDPKETLYKAKEYLKKFQVDALGIASFGPIDINEKSSKYGYITNTPKERWQNTNFVGYMKEKMGGLPISWTTDVNAAAYGEYIMWERQGKKVDSLVYYTIGTGVGAGAVVRGDLIGGTGHPEMGHVLLKRHSNDNFPGICPFHKDCLEGLVSGPTFEFRLNKKGEDVSKEDPIWDMIAYYIAQAAMQITLILRPEKIVFGGGVVSEPLLEKVREELKYMLNDYIPLPDLRAYISMPVAESNGSATIGNFALAQKIMM